MQGPGQSSLSIWTPFASEATATVRHVKARCLISWNRVELASSFAIVGTSRVNGTDVVQGVGDNVLNTADLYDYVDETARVLRIEYERNLIEPLGGSAIAQATVVLDNTDLRFTPDYDASIGTAIKPNRPLKLFIGFEVQGQEVVVPIIEGLSLQPKENKNTRTVQFNAYDFMQFLNEKPQETAIYTNQRTDEIIADILSRAGVGSSTYELDQGLNTVGFAWFEKGQKAGERIRKLCEAEEGFFYQDESGVFRFETRDKYSRTPYTTPVWTIEPDDIIQWEQDFNSRIINRALVKGAPRSVKGETEIWRDGIEEEIEAGQTLTIWAEFDDPVSSVTAPDDQYDFTAFTGADGTGSDITNDIAITVTSFTKTAKLDIQNNNGAKAYVNLLRLRGTPATVDYEIQEVFQDDTSIDSFNENQEEVDNPYVDNRSFARSMATGLVRRHKDPLKVIRIMVRGLPHLQLRDQIRVKDLDLGTYKNYRLIGIQGVFEPGSFVQTLRLREITENETK